MQAKDKHGISTLLAAIWEGHTDCVKLLLSKVSTSDISSSIPASNYHDTHSKMFVLFQGANKEGSAPDGKTYFEAAEKDEIKSLLK